MPFKLQEIEKIALEAGKIVMEFYIKGFTTEYKADNSPLTQADLAANESICKALENLTPLYPILSEESQEIPYEERKDWQYYWCIDPIDGTKEFIQKNNEFTINIALIYNGSPILGVVYTPALDLLYSAKKDEGAFKTSLNTKKREKLPLATLSTCRVLCSKSHHTPQSQEFIDTLKNHFSHVDISPTGSSLKFCLIAEGSATIYPKFGKTMEWDSAAAQCIVKESGKGVYIYNPDLEPSEYLSKKVKTLQELYYNKPSLENPYFIVV